MAIRTLGLCMEDRDLEKQDQIKSRSVSVK